MFQATTLAENLYLDVQKYIARENVAICPNGIPDMGDAIIRRLVPADSSNPLNILFLSNMMEEKGVSKIVSVKLADAIKQAEQGN